MPSDFHTKLNALFRDIGRRAARKENGSSVSSIEEKQRYERPHKEGDEIVRQALYDQAGKRRDLCKIAPAKPPTVH